MAFATYTNLASRWRVLSPEEQTRATILLGDAAWWLKVWFKPYGDLEALAAADELLAEGLLILSCNMVRRSMISGNYEGAAQLQQTMGPFNAQVSYRNPDGNLFVYDLERDAILSLLGINVSGAVSMTAPGL